jgi:hypothetical protein
LAIIAAEESSPEVRAPGQRAAEVDHGPRSAGVDPRHQVGERPGALRAEALVHGGIPHVFSKPYVRLINLESGVRVGNNPLSSTGGEAQLCPYGS